MPIIIGSGTTPTAPPSSPSWEAVCNIALIRLGVKTLISDLSASDKSSSVCNSAYALARDKVLEGYDWRCAVKRATLVQNPTAPLYGWSYQYYLPSNPWCLVVREIWPHTADYVVEGRSLLSNFDSSTDDLSIRYTSRIMDPSYLSSGLALSIAWQLASMVCYAFVQSGQLQQAIEKELLVILADAQNTDNDQNKNHDEDNPSSVTDWAYPGLKAVNPDMWSLLTSNNEWISQGR